MSNIKLVINNDYSYLNTNDQELLDFLYNNLRFLKRNYQNNIRYRKRLWSGHIDFFSKKGKFLTGLLPEVKYVLKHFNKTYTEVDKRENIQFLYEKIDKNFLKNITLHDYQVDFTNKVIKYKRATIKAPTGSGKGVLPATIIKCLPEIPILILGNRRSIINQNYEEMVKYGIKDIGKFYGKEHNPQRIICATLQSLHHLEPYLDKFKALIVDEIHMVMSNKAIKFYKKLKNCSVRVALSATPFKYGETDKVHKFSVKGFFGPIIKTDVTESGILTTNYLQSEGTLSESICNFYPIDSPEIHYDTYQDAVTNGISKNLYFHQIVSKLAKSRKGRTLIIVERLAHGDMLSNLIPNALWIQGKDNDETRNYVKKQLQIAPDNVIAIATQGIFNTGVNVFIHNLINAAGGTADHEIIQRMGRGLRTANDKEILNYYDFYFTINPYLEKHSKSRIKILKKEQHKIIVHKTIDF